MFLADPHLVKQLSRREPIVCQNRHGRRAENCSRYGSGGETASKQCLAGSSLVGAATLFRCFPAAIERYYVSKMLWRFLAAALVTALGITGQEKAPEPARIEGKVLDAITGQPVRKAAVIIRQEKVQDLGFAAVTDAAGHFEFTGLAAATWVAEVQRDGYATLGGALGGTDAKDLKWPLAAGAVLKDLTLRLTPAGVVTGRVLDTDGEPLASASVMLTPQGAKPAPQAARYGQTNDLGEYRIYNVAPGRYLVSVNYERQWKRLGIQMLEPPDKSGRRRPTEDYIRTYYPGTPDAAQAAAVRVGAGAQVPGIDIRLVRAGGVRVRGRIAASEGAQSPFTLVIMMEAGSVALGAGKSYDAIARGDGAFEFDSVRPGRYLLQCTSAMGSQQLHGRQWVEVGDADVEGIQVTLSPPRKIEGKLSVEGQTPLPGGLHAMLIPREDDPTHMGGGFAPVRQDGSFTLEQVYNGTYDLVLAKLQGEPDDFYLKSMRFGDSDALEDGLEVNGPKPGKLEVVLGDDGAALECKVASSKGEPAVGAHVIVVPDAPKQHALALYDEAKTDEKGECKVIGIAPGAYHVFAFDAKREIDFRHPENLKPFEDSGKAVRLAAKQRARLELTAIPAESDKQ
jgi:hypothetical protein